MTKNELNEEYLQWMYELVVDQYRYSNVSYQKLFQRLYDTEFTYQIPMDGNRAEDGIDLRYRFGREMGYEDSLIATLLDIRSCSVLEMMIALAIRCEENIMDNPDVGDRTGQWFWNMLVSLGIGSEDDARFDSTYVDGCLRRFLNRDYNWDGKGGLFTVENPPRDMRRIEIWYQLNFYLQEIIDEGSP